MLKQLDFIQQLNQQPLTINNYIDNKLVITANINVNIDLNDEQSKFENQLSEIGKQLTEHPDLSILIEQYRKDLSNIGKNSNARKSLFEFITDLGDRQTPISKLLSGAGTAKDILLNTV